ncbi:MAG: NitT/TauT family transport system permease protein [Streptosporangiaceae bacterium]|jgi:NitT/TauT family transport system permease protein|nr:NitT/TauT family transport system permease protein [Streptosporangiaceae bacterium]
MTARTDHKAAVTRFGLVAVLLAGYESVARAGMLDRQAFLPVSTAVADAVRLLADAVFWREHLGPTLGEVLAALTLGTATGFGLGVVLWRSRLAYEAVQPWLLLVYAIPVFALYPIFIAVLGGGAAPVIAVGALVAFPAVAINTAIGFRATRDVLAQVGRAYGLRMAGLVRQVYLPSAWPYVFSGIKLAASYAIVAVVGTEFILSTHGLGHEIAYAYNSFDTARMYAAITVVLVIAIVTVIGLGSVEKRLHRRQG